MSETRTFTWTRRQIGLAIDGVAMLVNHANRGGAESKLLHELQDAYRALGEAQPAKLSASERETT